MDFNSKAFDQGQHDVLEQQDFTSVASFVTKAVFYGTLAGSLLTVRARFRGTAKAGTFLRNAAGCTAVSASYQAYQYQRKQQNHSILRYVFADHDKGSRLQRDWLPSWPTTSKESRATRTDRIDSGDEGAGGDDTSDRDHPKPIFVVLNSYGDFNTTQNRFLHPREEPFPDPKDIKEGIKHYEHCIRTLEQKHEELSALQERLWNELLRYDFLRKIYIPLEDDTLTQANYETAVVKTQAMKALEFLHHRVTMDLANITWNIKYNKVQLQLTEGMLNNKIVYPTGTGFSSEHRSDRILEQIRKTVKGLEMYRSQFDTVILDPESPDYDTATANLENARTELLLETRATAELLKDLEARMNTPAAQLKKEDDKIRARRSSIVPEEFEDSSV